MKNKDGLGCKAADREFEVLYALYHHETLAKDEIPHHLHYPECNWLETTLDDLECSQLISGKPARWIYEITEKGKALMRDELSNLRIWYIYKAYLIFTTSIGIRLSDAAEAFHDLKASGMFEGIAP